MSLSKKLASSVAGLLLALPLAASGQTERLPIETFLDAQPTGTVDGWTDPATYRNLVFDAYGKRAAMFGLDLGTTFDGGVTVTPLPNDRARVTVLLHTNHAACWGYQWGEGWSGAPELAFGSTMMQISKGAEPTFGDATERIEFTMPAGGPIPAIRDVFANPAFSLEFFLVTINCAGVLHSGSGYPDGTPGRARTTQAILMSTGVPAGCPPEQDANCAPAEIVEFWPVGGGQ